MSKGIPKESFKRVVERLGFVCEKLLSLKVLPFLYLFVFCLCWVPTNSRKVTHCTHLCVCVSFTLISLKHCLVTAAAAAGTICYHQSTTVATRQAPIYSMLLMFTANRRVTLIYYLKNLTLKMRSLPLFERSCSGPLLVAKITALSWSVLGIWRVWRRGCWSRSETPCYFWIGGGACYLLMAHYRSAFARAPSPHRCTSGSGARRRSPTRD